MQQRDRRARRDVLIRGSCAAARSSLIGPRAMTILERIVPQGPRNALLSQAARIQKSQFLVGRQDHRHGLADGSLDQNVRPACKLESDDKRFGDKDNFHMRVGAIVAPRLFFFLLARVSNIDQPRIGRIG